MQSTIIYCVVGELVFNDVNLRCEFSKINIPVPIPTETASVQSNLSNSQIYGFGLTRLDGADQQWHILEEMEAVNPNLNSLIDANEIGDFDQEEILIGDFEDGHEEEEVAIRNYIFCCFILSLFGLPRSITLRGLI